MDLKRQVLLFLLGTVFVKHGVTEFFMRDGDWTFGQFLDDGSKAFRKSGAVIYSALMANLTSCLFECLYLNGCFAFNAEKKEKDLTCEFLNFGKSDYANFLVDNSTFQSYRLMTKCTDNPCKNGGVCSPLENGGELFSCTCPASHTGDVCHYLLDTPTGTLTSPPFKFLGPTLSFMIGGGCDVNYERAELLIDGAVVHKSTGIKKADGYCQSETMGKASWDVSAYLGRTAHVRLVDASSGNWGHINFDHVTDSCP